MRYSSNGFNDELIEKFLSDITEYYLFIHNTVASQNDRDIIHNRDTLDLIKYRLMLCVEAMANVARHILARKFLVGVEEYSESFRKLGDYNIISPQLASSLARLGKMRNLLMHGYWKIDNQVLLQHIRNGLSDIKEFVKGVQKTVHEHENK